MADEQTSILSLSLDDYFRTTAIGSIERAIGDNMYGINHMQTPGMVPSSKDAYGYTFFTRPQLNFQTDNLRNDRKMYPLLTDNVATSQRAIRCLLDPRQITGYRFKDNKIPAIACPLMDNQNAFIPLLSNNLSSISGWPDMAVPTFTSKAGLYNEAWGQVDGIIDNYESYDVTATFRNTRGAPIMALFYFWERYSALVFQGLMVPYLDYIVENRIDYNTRIYRITTDATKTYVTNICATGVAWPISNPTGALFDYNTDTIYNEQNKDISIQFRALGFEWQDDILINEFNKTVQIFNAGMRDDRRETDYYKVSPAVRVMVNHRCYPRINPLTFELEWWVPTKVYDVRTLSFLESQIGSGNEEYSGD